MKIFAVTGTEDVARVYIADFSPDRRGENRYVEFVEAVQPPTPREQKWVLLVSTMFGCPVRCMMCDAGGFYQGRCSAEEILAQIDFLVTLRYPDRRVPARNFKIQFARMGEPALNPAVLDALAALPSRYQAPGLMPSLSTIAPHGSQAFFERLLDVKQTHYSGGAFQFQFSLHTTDDALRDRIIPVRKWSLAQMAAYGERFWAPGDRKITLNFALAQGSPLEAPALLRHFDPARYLIKITPLNPTHRASQNGLETHIDPHQGDQPDAIVSALQEAGYQVIVSIGEVEENLIGSNCGQYVLRHMQAGIPLQEGYTYAVKAA